MLQICACIALFVEICAISENDAPKQIHLSIGEKTSTITVTWVTSQPTDASMVQYATNQWSQRAYGQQDKFVDGGEEKREFYVHRVTLRNLTPSTSYFYICGSETAWSDVFSFRVLRDDSNWSPRLAIFGDMGTTNNKALPGLIQQVVSEGTIDVVLHAGDIAYNMDNDNGRNGDLFMRQIQPVATRVPYMTVVGNHEFAYNFSNYRARFTMPGGDGESQFYSFNVGPAHIIAYSTEFFYAVYNGWQLIVRQYEWLSRDLEEANRPLNRARRPWIIAVAHRPMYCSNTVDAMHCATVDNLVRTGFPYTENGRKDYILGLEDLFYRHGVNLIIAAHEHSYERFWPLYNRTVCNASLDSPYFNPPAPVHIVTGSAGSPEGMDPFIPGGYPWSAFRSDDYGFTRMQIHNQTHLSIEQFSVVEGGLMKIIDSVTIVSMTHDQTRYTCHQKT